MGMKLTVGLSVAAVAALSFAVLSFGNGNGIAQELEPMVVAQTDLKGETLPVESTEVQKNFQSMAVDADLPECSVPRPPNELDPMALVRNSYAAILEILALQRWQETGTCNCPYNQISWDEAVNAAPEFERTDGVALRFDFPKLRVMADELTSLHSAACSG